MVTWSFSTWSASSVIARLFRRRGWAGRDFAIGAEFCPLLPSTGAVGRRTLFALSERGGIYVWTKKEPVKDGMFKTSGGRAGGVLIGGFGFVITLAALILACVPGEEVDNVATFYLTVFGSLAMNLAMGVAIYFYGRRRMVTQTT